MSEPVSLDESVAVLSNYFVGDETLGDTLNRIAELTTKAIPQAAFVGVTMMVEGRVGTYVFTHPDVPEIDREQYETGDGPCVEAFSTNNLVVISSTLTCARFRDFCAVAADHGILSTLSVPMATGRQTVGALNLYATEENAFDEHDVERASLFATQAGFLLTNGQAYWDARSLSENLSTALEFRSVIEQAKGIIIGATGCSPDDAFEQLRAQSQHENVKLRDVALRIVEDAQRRP